MDIRGGMVGNEPNSGLYRSTFVDLSPAMFGSTIPVTEKDFVDALKCKIKKGASIRFFSCNNVGLARMISQELYKRRKEDPNFEGVIVIGANNYSYPDPKDDGQRRADNQARPDIFGNPRPGAKAETGYFIWHKDGKEIKRTKSLPVR